MMNPFETPVFRDALKIAFAETIRKVGVENFKRISWFASNEVAEKTLKAA